MPSQLGDPAGDDLGRQRRRQLASIGLQRRDRLAHGPQHELLPSVQVHAFDTRGLDGIVRQLRALMEKRSPLAVKIAGGVKVNVHAV